MLLKSQNAMLDFVFGLVSIKQQTIYSRQKKNLSLFKND